MCDEKKLAKMREREIQNAKKVAERTARETERMEKRQKKLEIRMEREKAMKEQKEAALRRAADLVVSNRVPIEITRGAAAIANTPVETRPVTIAATNKEQSAPGKKSRRSSIVVSTASDLHQIVTHSNNLWAKYNAIAKEHNQKVNWITVAKEIGIHVKVREKYARMHHRAIERGFDFLNCGHYKIKDCANIFLEPLQNEKKSQSQTVTIPMDQNNLINSELIRDQSNRAIPDDRGQQIAKQGGSQLNAADVVVKEEHLGSLHEAVQVGVIGSQNIASI